MEMHTYAQNQPSVSTRKALTAVLALLGACMALPATAQQGWIPEECGPDFEEANIIMGTEGDDSISGTRDRDVIFGLGGNDNIYGGNGDDCLIGGPGNDFLMGGAGNDVLVADGEGGGEMTGNPVIHSRDRLNGSRGSDICYGSYGYYDLTAYGESYDTVFINCEVVYEPREMRE
ncbi:calcium-binding protein [Sinimarinibacterium sp. CAU 1509]|uniref:calcium-binding protein n=1 Tax=Sinimarinibacterium sp. CAU 1509 TaxID=2562283 RepID=UPI001B7FB8A9|nr:hypothetical protein [Sinimarinibacterium sp. CAU 1509]